ncbi:MAG: DUF484 family protein [Litoreibacter sp.]|nr:DUF484 family protein [Litoreibacter sp.]
MLGTMREKILSDPEVVLEDHDLMRALIEANERSHGSNIVDLRGIAMERLESRLDRLEDTHRSVIAAAYDNLAGTNLIHNAVLKLLEPTDFAAFLQSLSGELRDALRVSYVRLLLESKDHEAPSLGFDEVLSVVEPGTVDHYITAGRNISVRPVTLRQVDPASEDVYGAVASHIKSEGLMKLDLGDGRLPGLLIMGSDDPDQFRANQGTDLLAFFSGVFERAMRRWLA